jgi:hypothetical protein
MAGVIKRLTWQLSSGILVYTLRMTRADYHRTRVLWVRARKANNFAEFERLNQLLEEHQSTCPHPERSQTAAIAPTDGKSSVRKGDHLRWCLDCGQLLAVNGIQKKTPNMSVRCFGICKQCGRSVEDLKPCNNCGRLICSSCRCGTGSISDEYECLIPCGKTRFLLGFLVGSFLVLSFLYLIWS